MDLFDDSTFVGDKDLEVLAGAGNVINVIIGDVEQLIAVELNAARQNIVLQDFRNHPNFSLIPHQIEGVSNPQI